MRLPKGVCMFGMWFAGFAGAEAEKEIPKDMTEPFVITKERKLKMMELNGDFCKDPCGRCNFFCNLRESQKVCQK